jgi:hypothetical protein
MKLVNRSRRMQAAVVCSGALFLMAATAVAQDYPPAPQDYPQAAQGYPAQGYPAQGYPAEQNYPPPPSFSPQQLDNLVSRIALYPDPLLAQIFAAASFPDQVPEAARWANQYRNLHGNELADAIYQSNLSFDPAVQALIPFPDVLDMMARDMNWTSALGNAVLADRLQVMDSVQRMRRSAEQYGYLRSNQQMRVVNTGAAVEIVPADPELIYVPVYDPYIVYAPPRPGFFIGGAIRFGPSFSLGVFNGWGWGGGFNWYNHSVYVNRSVWGRTWYNRGGYVHNYGNWDRGNWRNRSYANRVTINNNRPVYRNENVNRYNNTYQNRGGYNRGSQSAPVIQNRGYDRNNSYQPRNGYSNSGNGSAPAVQNRGYERNDSSQPRNEYRNSGGTYNGGQAAAVPQTRSYDRGSYQPRSGNQNSSNAYSRGQSAPATQNRSFERNSNSGNTNRGASSAGQNRSSESRRGNDGGNGDRNSGRHR